MKLTIVDNSVVLTSPKTSFAQNLKIVFKKCNGIYNKETNEWVFKKKYKELLKELIKPPKIDNCFEENKTLKTMLAIFHFFESTITSPDE